MAPGQIFDMARVGLCTVVHTLQLRAAVENCCATTFHNAVSHRIGTVHLLILDHRCDSGFFVSVLLAPGGIFGIMIGFHVHAPPCFPFPHRFRIWE